jgi:predicted Holliday junction resolvase-like endonuclease
MTASLLTTLLLLLALAIQLCSIQRLQGQVEVLARELGQIQREAHAWAGSQTQALEALTAHIDDRIQDVQDEAVRRALKATHDAFSLPPIKPFQP